MNKEAGGHWVWVVLVGWAVLFYIVSWEGVKDKTATMDEPMHAVSAWATARTLDFRMDPDAPVLWKYWAALGQGRDALPVQIGGPGWEEALNGPAGTLGFARGAWLASGPERVDAFLGHQRRMMIVFGALLVVVTGLWAWEMGGPIAAVVAGGLVAMDPNILAHAPLIKADVVTVLVYALAAWGAWRVGRRGSAASIALALLAAAAGPVVKFSGVVVPVVVCAVVFIRAVMREPWWVLGRVLRTRGARVGAAVGFTVACAVVCYGVLWATYAFRAGPMVDEPGGLPVRASLARDGGVLTRAIYWAVRERIVPAAWGGGFIIQQGSAVSWPAFLLGMHGDRGWWYYFPIAMGVKTATATIAAAVAALWVVAWRWPAVARGHAWDLVGLGAPLLIYMACVMAAHVNAGLRHALEVYPIAYVGMGVVAGWVWRGGGRGHERQVGKAAPRSLPARRNPDTGAGARGRRVILALAVCVVAEVVAAGGNYLPFFNLIGRAVGPLELLGDANFDWGQDLKGLVAWQEAHPGVALYVAYFGPVAPSFYGLRYVPLPGVPFYGQAGARWPAGPGVMAVSATILQGIYAPPGEQEVYTPLRKRKPIGNVGGSIFLYDTSQLLGGGGR